MNSNTSPLRDESQLTDECIDWHIRNSRRTFGVTPETSLRILCRAIEAEVRSLRSQDGLETVGMFSVSKRGELAFHSGVTDAQYLTSTLNSNVTGGPYTTKIAYASPPSQSIASDVVAATWTNEQIDQIDVLAEGMLKKMVAAPDVLSRQSPVEADSTEYCWLVELRGPLVKRPSYHTGFTTLDGESRSTIDPHKAKRYLSQGAAQTVAEKLGFNLVGTWHAVEHGFHSAVAASPSPVEADTQRSE